MWSLFELQLLLFWLGIKCVRPLTCRGISYSLRPQQISYVLPGKDYTLEDLQSIFLQADAHAADHTLMETAWEVCQIHRTSVTLTEAWHHLPYRLPAGLRQCPDR